MRERHILRSVLVIATLSLFLAPVSAQLVFIPDTNFRSWLNDAIPGSIDDDGFLDTALPAVQAFQTTGLSITWEPFDLTGLEYLTGLDFLYLLCDGNDGVIPAFPPSLTWLAVNGYTGTQLPPMPAGLEDLYVENGQLAVQPQYPESLRFLQLGGLNLTTVGPLPPSLTQLKLQFVWPGLEELVGLPEGLDTLLLTGFAENINFCLPQLPDGMTFLGGDVLEGEPFECLPNIPENPAFHSNWPLPPLCGSGDICALITGMDDAGNPLRAVGPNPVHDDLLVARNTSDPTMMTIMDATGRTAWMQLVSGDRVSVDVSGFSPGLYTVFSATGRSSAVMRFMKE